MPLSFFAVVWFVVCVSLAAVAGAETLGSQTQVMVNGVYHHQGEYANTSPPDGSYRSISSMNMTRYGNREILETMVARRLIPAIRGYSIVMLRTDRGTRSFTFVATHATATPIRVPSDLLNLGFSYGPSKGRYAYNSVGVITELVREGLDVATLTLDGFEGRGMLAHKSSHKNVRRGDEVVTIKLTTANAALAGETSLGGVAAVAFTLSGAKVIDLDRFGSDAPTGEEDLIGGGSGGVIVEIE